MDLININTIRFSNCYLIRLTCNAIGINASTAKRYSESIIVTNVIYG